MLNLSTRDDKFYANEDDFLNNVASQLELDNKKYLEIKKQKTINAKMINFSNKNEVEIFGINNQMSKDEKIKNPRVGTIDKFQGQEAPITIISMTSSDPENLPRNKEFFFSRNRLNVAISRAQCISIILFNSNLLNFVPKSVDQIKLINNFYKIKKKYKKIN